jgi:hypothetical protein
MNPYPLFKNINPGVFLIYVKVNNTSDVNALILQLSLVVKKRIVLVHKE